MPKTKEADKATTETKRGRTTEPFHKLPAFALTLSFHDEISESAAGRIVTSVLESLSTAVAEGNFQQKRVTRGEPSDNRQTFKIAPETYDWPEPSTKAERGARVDSESAARLDNLVLRLYGMSTEKMVKRTGKPASDIRSMALKRFDELMSQAEIPQQDLPPAVEEEDEAEAEE